MQNVNTIDLKEVVNAGHIIETLDQGTVEWHQWRSHGLGASSVPTVLGENPFQTPYRLWAEKVGLVEPEDLSRNPNVLRGVNNEDAAREAWEAKTGDFAVPLCLTSRYASWIRVSLDGLTAEKVVLEIKCPSAKKMAALRSKIADRQNMTIGSFSELDYLGFGYYYGQTQYQMVTAGAAMTSLWLYDVEAGEGIELYIPLNEEYAQGMLEKALAFWNMVQSVTAPDLIPERDVLNVAMLGDSEKAEWDQAESAYTELERSIKELESEVKALKEAQDAHKQTLLSIAGIWPKVESDTGFKLTSFARLGTVDYKAALAKYAPEISDKMLDAFRKETTNGIRITVPKPKK